MISQKTLHASFYPKKTKDGRDRECHDGIGAVLQTVHAGVVCSCVGCGWVLLLVKVVSLMSVQVGP